MKSSQVSLLFFLFLITQLCNAQVETPIVFTPVNGFSQNNVIAIAQDRYGFMWFGTRNGLNMYDGVQFTVFQNDLQNDKSLSNSTVTSVFEDKDNDLWIGTYVGLNKFVRKKQQFERFLNNPNDTKSLSVNYISALVDDSKGNLIVGTFKGGVNIYDKKTNSFRKIMQRSPEACRLSNDFVTSLLRDRKGRIWVGTRNGLNVLNASLTNCKSFIHNNSDRNSIGNNYITSLCQDLDGVIWIATTEMGLYKCIENVDGSFSFESIDFYKVKIPFYKSVQILSLMVDAANNLWIGTENAGLYVYNCRLNKSHHYEKQLFEEFTITSNSIYSIFKSNDEIIWVGTYDQGVCKYDPNKMNIKRFYQNPTSKNILNNNNIKAIAENNGSLWIGTDGGGLTKVSKNNYTSTNYIANYADGSLKSNAIMSLYSDDKQNLWIGSWNGGVYLKTKNQNKFKQYTSCITPSGPIAIMSVTAIVQDKKGVIWASNFGSGLMYFDENKKSFVQFIPDDIAFYDLVNANIYSLYIASDGNLWLGSLLGAYCLNLNNKNIKIKKYIHNPSNANSLSNSYVMSIVEDNHHAIWIGTFGGGVNKIDLLSNTITRFTTVDGLSNNVIRAMIKDQDGVIWISTDKGITRLEPSDNSFKVLWNDVIDAAGEFQGTAALRDSSGNVYFGSNNGFVRFNPNTINPNKTIPVVYLTGLKLFNKDIDVSSASSPLDEDIRYASTLTLDYNQTVFTLTFAALNFTESNRNQYAYMLEGFDKTWNNIGRNNSATYTNLNPGVYTFKVKGSNNDGVWSAQPAVITIIIKPAPWFTWWAKLIYIIILIIVIRYLLRFYTIRINERELLRLERIRYQNEEELNQKKLQFFTNISHEIRTPLSLIISPIEKLKKDARLNPELREVVDFAYINSRRLYRLINELLDFRKLDNNKLKLHLENYDIVPLLLEIAKSYEYSAKLKKIQFSVLCQYDSYLIWFDANKFEKIIHNLLSNALKFTPEGGVVELEFRIDESNRFLNVYVRDTGVGIAEEHLNLIFDRFYQVQQKTIKNTGAGTGIGLSLSRELALVHKGEITVTSVPNVSTEFLLKLPLDKKIYEASDLESASESRNGMNNISDYEIGIDERFENTASTRSVSKNKPVLLIVEDNKDVRDYLKSELKDKFRVLEAENGKIGIEIIKSESPVLIISDIMMPVMDGLEFCNYVKTNIETCHIPLILLTAKVDEDDTIKGIVTGADAYMAKPFSIRVLVATVNNLIERRLQIYKVFSQEAVILPSTVTSNKLDEDFLNKVIEYIHSNITETELGVESLAAYMNMSRSQIYRKVKAITDISANEFIRLLRLKKSLKLLESGKYTISEVSYMVGFNAPSYFASCFKEQFGKTPTEIMDKNKSLKNN